MGCNVKDKSLRGNRKSRNSSKQQNQSSSNKQQNQSSSNKQQQHRSPADSNVPPDPNLTPESSSAAASSTYSVDFSNAVAAAISAASASDLGYCTEEQLEDLLLAKLDFLYKEALAKLSALGYDDEVALHAVLHNGHSYGSMDLVSNIVHNALSFLNSNAPNPDSPGTTNKSGYNGRGFANLRQLHECTITGMVCLLQDLQPHLSRGDAMWCLLMSDLHIGRARAVEVPVHPSSSATGSRMPPVPSDTYDAGELGCSTPGSMYRFHGGCGDEREGEVPRQFNVGSSGRPFSKKDAATLSAGHCMNSKLSLPTPHLEVTSTCLPVLTQSPGHLNCDHGSNDEEPRGNNSDISVSILKSMENMSLEERDPDGQDDPRNEMILNLINQIKSLEKQVKEQKEWAQQKALQAARKLSNDLMELNLLRMERDDNQRLKKGKQTLEDGTLKRLTEMEIALRKSSGQVDRANVAVRQLEAENAELRAEMEASNLSNAESERMCLEIAKREKKHLKKLLSREKQKEKMEEEVMEIKKKIPEVQQKLHDITEQRKTTEEKLKETIKAKEQAIAMVEEEKRAKEAAEENIRRRHEALRQKTEIDLQRQKDDIQRLEDELARLKSSSLSQPVNSPTSIFPSVNAGGIKLSNGSSGKTLRSSQKSSGTQQNKVARYRECMLCNKEEVSIVFLPCAHQVLCTSCNGNHEKRMNTCPCCMVAIQHRIRVYGTNS